MRLTLFFATILLIATACAPAPPPVQPTAVPTPIPPTATPTPVPPPAQPPAGLGQEQVSAKVSAITSSQLTLEGGKSYTIAANTRYSHPIMRSFTDLMKGDFVGITAQLDPADASLKASQVALRVPGANGPQTGQRPLLGANLMTDATIESVDAGVLTVAFGTGTVKVKMAPGGVIFSTEAGNIDAVKAGTLVTVVAANGAAVSISY